MTLSFLFDNIEYSKLPSLVVLHIKFEISNTWDNACLADIIGMYMFVLPVVTISDDIDFVLENEILLDEEKEDDEILERCIEKEDILNELDKIDEQIESVKEDMEITETKKDVKIENKVETQIENKIETKVENKSIEKINSLFDTLDSSVETYKTYKVCIIRTGDTIESVLQKYSISKEELEKYNNLTDIKIGDKLIIPSITDAKI